MREAPSVQVPRVLLDQLGHVESARWHDGRLWFANWGMGEIVAVDLDGTSEVMGAAPPKINAAKPGHGLGWSIDWLPDGRLLLTGKDLLRREPDGSMVRHADLAGLADFWNEIVVDSRGNVYINSIAFQYLAGADQAAGIIALVTADGEVRQVAGELAFPNGMVITPDDSTLIVSESMAGRLTAFDIAPDGSLTNRRVWAEGLAPDGITMDGEGAVWVQAADIPTHPQRGPQGAVVRISEDGMVLARIEHDRAVYSVMLGGPDGKTLFLAAAEWHGFEQVDGRSPSAPGRSWQPRPPPRTPDDHDPSRISNLASNQPTGNQFLAREESTMKQYLLSIYQPDTDPPPAEVLAEISRQLEALREEMRSTGSWVFSGGLHPPSTATVIHPRRDEMPMTDGPYVEGKEHIGGFTIIKAADLDEALQWGRKLAQATTLPIEVRPFLGELED